MSIEMIFWAIFFGAIIISIVFNIEKIAKVFNKSKPRRKVFIDTSVLIDGRILEIAKSGFLGDEFFIPKSVMRELQLLADGKNSEKRARARFGMDVANELERVTTAEVKFYSDTLDRTLVDERLIELAKRENGMILTMDFNLGKVAESEKIQVLNINNLMLALRQENLSGEKMKLKIKNEGSNNKQGVGHLDDGTMVVVENAKNKVGKEVVIEFTHPLQTNSGKIWFAKLAAGTEKGNKK